FRARAPAARRRVRGPCDVARGGAARNGGARIIPLDRAPSRSYCDPCRGTEGTLPERSARATERREPEQARRESVGGRPSGRSLESRGEEGFRRTRKGPAGRTEPP